MFCSQCGTAVLDGAKFCKSCGSRLNQEEQAITATNEAAPLQTPVVPPAHAHVNTANVSANPRESLASEVNNHSGDLHKNAICLHCGFKGAMAVDVVIAPGHEGWKPTLIIGILFLILFVFLMTEGISPGVLLIPLGFFLFSAYSYSQKLECFHCSNCHEISYKSGNGTWSKEKDTRKWYLKNWTDSSLPTHQKIILFVVFVCVFGFIRIYFNGRS